MNIEAVAPLSETLEKNLKIFLSSSDNRGHVNRDRFGGDVSRYAQHNLSYAMETIARVKNDVPEQPLPERILDLGCSAGYKVTALRKQYPESEIFGIDPEKAAIEAAQALVEWQELSHIHLTEGVGESLPYPDNYFDLITCHSVLEHVHDVDKVVQEMARVLKRGGVVHLDVPNYMWPYEPHLRVYFLPLLGKKLLKLAARLQGKHKDVNFVDHLQLVNPWRLGVSFSKANLMSQNLLQRHVEKILGKTRQPKRFKYPFMVLSFLKPLKVHKGLAWVMEKTGIYPMMLFKMTKP